VRYKYYWRLCIERTKNNNPNSTKEEKNLFAMLDKGINDMEEGCSQPCKVVNIFLRAGSAKNKKKEINGIYEMRKEINDKH